RAPDHAADRAGDLVSKGAGIRYLAAPRRIRQDGHHGNRVAKTNSLPNLKLDDQRKGLFVNKKGMRTPILRGHVSRLRSRGLPCSPPSRGQGGGPVGSGLTGE